MSSKPTKVRRHGEGTVSEWAKSKSPATKYQASIRATLPDGTRKRITAYGPTPKIALAKRKQKVQEALSRHKASHQLTLAEYAATWLQTIKDHKRKASTIADYAQVLTDYVLPTLGQHTLASVTTEMIEELQSDLIKSITNENKDGRGSTGHRTANKVKKTIQAIYNLAERRGIVERNPARTVPSLPDAPAAVRLWSPTEIHKFLHTVTTGEILNPDLAAKRSKHDGHKASWYAALFYTAISMGLRVGELCALEWTDIRHGKLHVERTYSRSGKTWLVGPPKTPASRRALPLSVGMQSVLEQHRARLELHAMETKRDWADNNLMFPSMNGRLIHPPNLGKRLREYALKAGVDPLPFHALRKIFTTEFLRAGGSPKQAQYWLGHSTSTLVMEIYGQLQEELDMAAAVLDIDNVTGVDRTAIHTAKQKQPTSKNREAVRV